MSKITMKQESYLLIRPVIVNRSSTPYQKIALLRFKAMKHGFALIRLKNLVMESLNH